jgi:hypothetical protein
MVQPKQQMPFVNAAYAHVQCAALDGQIVSEKR